MPTLNWIGKEQVVNHDKEVPFRLLKKVKSLSVGENSQNLIIHGDNLEALKALMPHYYGKVKCIYIDPPYNTGNEGWVYNDKVNSPKIKKWLGKVVGGEAEDLCRHDKWLCMMYPRLKLLRELLSDEGTIFISINEDELFNLSYLCNEIFGEDNYLTTFTVKVRHEDRILKGDKDFHEVVEYLIMFRKSKKFKTVKRIFDNTSVEDYVYLIEELNKNLEETIMGNKKVWMLKPHEFKVIKKIPSEKNLKKINIRGSIKEGNSSGRFYMNYLSKLKDKNGYLFKVENMGDDGSGSRYFLMPASEKKLNGDYFQGVPQNREATKEVPFANYLDFTGDFNNVGYEGDIDFRFGKKPINFIKKIFEMGGVKNDKKAIILDSFSGSGSTGHTVLDLNKEDKGNRKFILVEMEEYATNITAERIKKAIKKENYEDGFEFCELDKPLFNEEGKIDEECTFEQLAQYVYFTETQTNLDKKQIKNSLIGSLNETDYYLIFKEKGSNVLNKFFLKSIKKDDNKRVIYADKCLLDEESLEKHKIQFKQIPYEVRIY
ncbi:MAG: site-specific DNA-methyltransferase [Nanoarchaeota archaeon]